MHLKEGNLNKNLKNKTEKKNVRPEKKIMPNCQSKTVHFFKERSFFY
jgi:hypothetical protein